MNPLRRLAMWVVWNVSLPSTWAPHVLGFALGSKGREGEVME